MVGIYHVKSTPFFPRKPLIPKTLPFFSLNLLFCCWAKLNLWTCSCLLTNHRHSTLCCCCSCSQICMIKTSTPFSRHEFSPTAELMETEQCHLLISMWLATGDHLKGFERHCHPMCTRVCFICAENLTLLFLKILNQLSVVIYFMISYINILFNSREEATVAIVVRTGWPDFQD